APTHVARGRRRRDNGRCRARRRLLVPFLRPAPGHRGLYPSAPVATRPTTETAFPLRLFASVVLAPHRWVVSLGYRLAWVGNPVTPQLVVLRHLFVGDDAG